MRKFKSASLKALLACACSASVLLPQTVVFLQAEAAEEIINDSDARITYSAGTGRDGGWTAGNTGGTHENSEHWANVAGANFTFSFTGNALELYGPKKTGHKKISVKIDAHDAVTVDCYGTENQNGLLLYNSRTDGPELEQGEHTVLVTVLDESNPAAQNATGVAFNYAKVYSEPPVQLVETSIADSDASLTYSSGWHAEASEHWVNGSGYTIDFDFTGVGIDVIGVSDRAHRYMQIQIDDLDPIEFDCWSAERTLNVILFSSLNAGVSLKQGKHHATISTIAKLNPSCNRDESAAGVSVQGLKIYSEPEKQLYETILNDTDARITYSEGTGRDTGWTGEDQSGSYESSEHWTQGVGAWLSFTFTGTALDIYGIKDKGHRYMQIQIDDLDPIEFDCYTPGRVLNTLLFSSKEAGVELEQGLHVVRLETIAKANEAAEAANPGVSFQYAKLYSETEAAEEPVFEGFSFVEDGMTTNNHEPFKIQYLSGAWGGGGAHYPDLFHDGYEHYSNDLGASYEMTFTGTKVELYGDKNEKHGTYTIEIDGEKVGEADASTTGETLRQQLLFATDTLSDTEHTIRITLENTEGNQNKAIQLDYLKVTHNVTAPTALKLPASMSLAPEASYSLEAEVIPWVAFDQDLLWSSSERSVATVYNGKIQTAAVTEKKQTTITVRSKANPSVQAQMTLTVDPAREMLNAFVGDEKRLDLSEDNASLLLGEGDSFHATAWRNDTVASKLVVAAQDKDLKNVRATASSFTNADGDSLPADAVTLSWLEEVNANIGRGNAGAPVKAFPDKIGASATRDIDAGESGFVWAAFNIDKDVKPGLYSGTITVSADGLGTPVSFDYTIEVIDLLLEEAQSDLQLWQHPYSVANYYLGLGGNGATSNDFSHNFYFTDAHFALMKAEMEDYAKAGGHDAVANIVEEAWNHQSYYGDPSMVTWTKNADGSWSFDYTNYDKWIGFMIECGVLDPANGIGAIKCYSIVPWNNTVRYTDAADGSQKSIQLAPGSDAFNETWTAFLEDFLAHSEAKGWLDLTYISMDERDLNQMRPAGELVKSVKNEKGQSFKLSSAINADYTKPENYAFTDLIDDISVNLGSVENEAMKTLTAHRKELGLHTTIYTCTGDYPGNFTISDPGDNYWSVWYAMSTGTDGYMKWAFDNYVYDMTDNITYRYWEPGDGWFIYPESREGYTQGQKKGFVSTPRYEMLKKGVRDVTKAKVLLESEDVTPETKAELAAVIDAMSKPAKTTKYGSATYASAAARDSVHAQTAAIMEKVEKAEKEAAINQYVIDKAPLQALVTEADGKKADGSLNGVLDSAVKAFEKALTDAKAVLANDDATKADVKAAKKALEEAMAALEQVDKSELQAAVTAAKGLDLAGYIDNDAKTAFSQALQAAEAVLKIDAVLQENTVSDALKSLQDAQKALVKKADKTALNAAIAQAEVKKTDSSLNGVLASKIAAFETALAEAKTAAAKDDLLQPEADVKTKALNDAMDALVQVDKSGLRDAVNAAKALNIADYIDGDAKTAFSEALKEAEDVLKDEAVLLENTVANALKSLQDAQKALVKKADKTALNAAITQAETKKTDGSLNGVLASKVSAFETALAEAKAAAAKDDLLQPEADAKTKALNDAMDALVKVDKSQLRDAVNAAKALNLGGYIDGDAKTAFSEALKEAEDVLKDEAVLQENTVLDALKSLQDAQKALVKKADKTALKAAIAQAETKKTDGSLNGVLASKVSAFETALAEAKAAEAKDDLLQPEADAKTKALNDAMDALVKVDKSQLRTAVNAAKALDLAEYIDGDAKTVFSQALRAAEAVLKEDAILQENTVADALKALQDAQKALVKKADKTALNAAIAQAEVKKTDGSLNGVLASKITAFETALSEAKAAADKDNLLQPEADAKTKALTDAIAALVKVDKSGLQAAVDAASELDLDDYEDGAEKTAFTQALKRAEDVLKADAVLQENTVADALKALNDAKADLKKKAVIHTELLQSAVQLADSLQSDAFAKTEDLADRLADAKGVLKNPESQEQVDAAAKALNQELLALRYSISEAKLNALK